ncbi:MAG TPA: hypothetical protein VFQ61_22020 [Polyangiaceae bacterium]|nr:hypothetical protein [Polyangiaceae bacterium]
MTVPHSPYQMHAIPRIDGSDSVVAWFGCWPRFHDHYLVSAPTCVAPVGTLCIHAWRTQWELTDAAGRFLQDHHCLVTFDLRRVECVELTELVFPAIIFELDVCARSDAEGWAIQWSSSYGAEGRILVEGVSVKVEPRNPERKE